MSDAHLMKHALSETTWKPFLKNTHKHHRVRETHLVPRYSCGDGGAMQFSACSRARSKLTKRLLLAPIHIINASSGNLERFVSGTAAFYKDLSTSRGYSFLVPIRVIFSALRRRTGQMIPWISPPKARRAAPARRRAGRWGMGDGEQGGCCPPQW